MYNSLKYICSKKSCYPKLSRRYPVNYAIDEKLYVNIGGVRQNIRIRTDDDNLPVILFVHGGPGVCDRHWVLKYQSDIAKTATMVCWDQRGAGLSWDKSMKLCDLSVDRMIEDCHELLLYLKDRFRKTKIYMVGHSWGSILGSLTAERYPDDVAVYIGMGQFVNGADNEKFSYRFVLDEATRRGDKKALADLEKIGWPKDGHYASLDDLMVQRNLMTKYGGEDYGENEGIVKSVLIPILKSPEYSLADMWKYYKGAFFSLNALWEEVVDINLSVRLPELKMPVYLTDGRHDQNCPIPIAEAWFSNLKAPRKEWIWFEKSAHSPIKNEPEEWGKTVVRIVSEEESDSPTKA